MPKTGDVNLVEETENLFVYALTNKFTFSNTLIEKDKPYWGELGTRPSDKEDNPIRIIAGIEFKPPKFRRWSYSQENLDEMYTKGRLKIEKGKLKILIDKERIGTNWTDITGYSPSPIWGFSTENSEKLLYRVISTSSFYNEIIFDFFLGSGTTTAVAHKLGRKWIGVEMGEHFYTVILPRMKKVLAYDKSGISKEVKEYQGGGFFKYYELEQYEDALRRVKYDDSDLFDDPSRDVYSRYVFMKDLKMLEALEIDEKQNKIKVDLNKLYEGIDIAETLSNLTGKWIKRISAEEVEFADGERVNLKDLDWRLIKPLIWW